jgi:hypothetical protein
MYSQNAQSSVVDNMLDSSKVVAPKTDTTKK